MKKFRVIMTIGMLLLSGLTIISTNAEDTIKVTSTGNILYVGGSGPGNYTKIQDAIDDAESSDTVFVCNGTYCENIIVTKRVNLIGEDKNNTIIYGDGTSDVVKLSLDGNVGDGIELSGFTIRNSGFGNNAIKVLRGKYNIHNNRITNNYCGIFFYLLSGYSSLTENIIEYNSFSGIYMELATSVYIDSNIVADNNHAILANIVSSIKITRNSFINNTCGVNISDDQPVDDYSIYVFRITPNSIFYNNFVNNDINAVDKRGPVARNSWDNDGTLGGNYWDDYNCVDNDGNGIGDTPYNISGGDNKDYYLLMKPYTKHLEVKIIHGINRGVFIDIKNVEKNYSAVGINYNISVTGGVLGLINSTTEGIIPLINIGDDITVNLTVLGFGIIKIDVTVDDTSIETEYGLIFGRFVFIPNFLK
jgi:nitrous oxidase accessory protein NosD